MSFSQKGEWVDPIDDEEPREIKEEEADDQEPDDNSTTNEKNEHEALTQRNKGKAFDGTANA